MNNFQPEDLARVLTPFEAKRAPWQPDGEPESFDELAGEHDEAIMRQLTRNVCGQEVRWVTPRKRSPYVLGVVGAAIAIALCVGVAVSVAAAPVCGWPEPGADPYRGNQADAVMLLGEIPADVRRQLADMVRQGYGWRRVLVTRDAADDGRLTDLRSMNFGAGRVCAGPVDRSMWPAGRHESGRAYAVGRWTVVTFDSCRNVALATDTHAMQAPAPVTRQSLQADIRRGGRSALGFDANSAAVNYVPEPSSWALGGLALVAALWFSRRKG